MFTYDIGVYQLGILIDNLRVSATNALEACNLAERQFKLVPCTNGSAKMVQWSGLEFQAKKVLR